MKLSRKNQKMLAADGARARCARGADSFEERKCVEKRPNFLVGDVLSSELAHGGARCLDRALRSAEKRANFFFDTSR